MVSEFQGTVDEFGDWCGYSGMTTELGLMMRRSDHDESSVLISLRSDRIAMCRRPHGGVAVLEAKNKSANSAKNK